MYQAYATRLTPRADGVLAEISLSGSGRQNSTHYVVEIVVEQGPYLSVPNEAIIESEGTHVVYVEAEKGRYLPREITPGIQGELYTQVLDGLTAGQQVVTFGSFFIDADHKLKEF